jgi:hypothetical protein
MTTKFSKHKWWIITALITAPLVALAAGVPNVFAPNTVISSAAVNANFTNLADRVTALEAATARTKATTILDNFPGPLNPTGVPGKVVTYTATGASPLLILVSGSGYVSAPPLLMDIAVQYDGVAIGHLTEYSNEVGSHKAFPTRAFLVAAPTAQSHNIGLIPVNALTDGNDAFTVTVIELH